MALAQVRLDDAHSLEGDGISYMYQITPVGGGIIRLKANNTVHWRANDWEGTAIQLDQRGQNSDGTFIRPKLTIANPLAAYSVPVRQGLLNNAEVIEFQVLNSHLTDDLDTYVKHTWRIRRVLDLSRVSVQFELRDVLDGQSFILPARVYIPPEFPSVSL